MSLSIGQTAPDFTLFDSARNPVTLSEQRGHTVLLLFFPQAFTRVCTQELCSIRDNMARYNAVKARVFGISVDSVFTLARFKEEQGYDFPLLSDFNKEVSGLYGSLYSDWILNMKGVSKRSAFVIDKEGRVQYAEVMDKASDVPDFEKISQVLGTLH